MYWKIEHTILCTYMNNKAVICYMQHPLVYLKMFNNWFKIFFLFFLNKKLLFSIILHSLHKTCWSPLDDSYALFLFIIIIYMFVVLRQNKYLLVWISSIKWTSLFLICCWLCFSACKTCNIKDKHVDWIDLYNNVKVIIKMIQPLYHLFNLM